MDEQLENRLRYLRKVSTEQMPHPSEVGLFDQLLVTRRLLVEWGARPALCDAGLFHSVYSTEHYELKAIPLSMRDEVRQLIGDEAESLVWLFCMMRRKTFDQNAADYKTNMLGPAGQCFVLGDNSTHSLDTRYFGCVPAAKITGRAWLCYWPPKRIGLVK